MKREAQLQRKTIETDVFLQLSLDGTGNGEIDTGIGFINHMLTQIKKHGFMDMTVSAQGDIDVDFHHTVEDIGISLGLCIKEALKDKSSIARYGNSVVPMDEALVMVVLDISGRGYLSFDASFTAQKIGDFDTELIEEFFRAVAHNAGITLHIRQMNGKNNHHIAEAIFKAFGKALDQAVSIDPRVMGVQSTKGIL